MSTDLVERIARAVLYEGYILYPYRPSVKNRQRWTFGGLCPRSYCEAMANTESWSMQTLCLVAGDANLRINGSVRFLHLMDRRVATVAAAGEHQFVASLTVGGKPYQSWQEAVEREVAFEDIKAADLLVQPRHQSFSFAPSRQTEELRDRDGKVGGMIVREQQGVSGAIQLAVEPAADRLFKLTIRVENRTTWEPHGDQNRDEAMLRALVSTHTILAVYDGQFVSMLDPPAIWSHIAADCQNVGTWPVLVGEPGQCDTLLSSPIILYDYPEVAPESPGDLFDATEIDEILTLRILSLTDEEKRAMVAVDERAATLLERTEALTAEQMRNMHGAIRSLRPLNAGACHE